MNDTVNQDVATSVDPLAIPEFLKRAREQQEALKLEAPEVSGTAAIKAEDVK